MNLWNRKNVKVLINSQKNALEYHRLYKGKIEIMPKVPIESAQDFSIWYTPGVAEPCKIIQENKDMVFEYTNRWNAVAIISDCTRVLGLGDIGPEAGYPVMESKALLFKFLGGVDAIPICLGTNDQSKIVDVVKYIQPSFGGINLEDIEQPKCYRILERLKPELKIPVWHDDQQGTATIVLSALINSLKIIGKRMDNILVSMIGSGAANMAIAKLIAKAGVKLDNIFMVDSKGILHPGRKKLRVSQPEKWEMCLKTNGEWRKGGIADAMKDADVCIAFSRPGPGIITKKMVKSMNDDAIIFACANPVPEILPNDVKEAGAKIVATGLSGLPNQINNSLGFPAIFRGVLDVRASKITDEMCMAAALELANAAEEEGLNENFIIPTMDSWEVYPREAVAVAEKAIEQGIAKIKKSRKELFDDAYSIIKNSREKSFLLIKNAHELREKK